MLGKTPKGCILIVDDKPGNLRHLTQTLSERGHTVQIAKNGPEALEMVLALPPDLILLDATMHGMDGFEVCRRMKANPQTDSIPIIFLNTSDKEVNVKIFDAGGADFITLPFKNQEIIVRVETHLRLQFLQRQLQGANTELARRLSDLAEANSILHERNEELDAFAHTVAHDLKNPLGLITGYAELLHVDAEVVDAGTVDLYAQYIMRGAVKMNTIINNLMLLAGTRKMDVAMNPLNMHEIVSEALSRLVDVVETQHAEIVIPENWPTAMGYAPWVEEVWTNYISNALKYGGRPDENLPPHVKLGFSMLDSELQLVPDNGECAAVSQSAARTLQQASTQPQKQIAFWVRDNGTGLTASELEQLFTPFERLDQAQIQGHGLGLSIVRRIVERLDGVVGARSETGRGCTFYFTLPAAETE